MNKIIVQKYGGSSVASIERVKRIAEKIVETAKDGDRVVVVVSAMGKTTDDLIKMAGQITSSPDERELDMLISTGEQVSIALLTMAIHALGWDAISFTGMQAGIITNAVHTKAKVTAVNHKKLKSALEKGKIVIVAGFQGIDANGDITTLGRGGSDTTAIALAAQLEADKCEIYTDVEGVYTADPRIVRTARRIPVISYDEMAEMASLGAKVMHYRAIDLARNYKVKILVKSSFVEGEGTLIKEVDSMLEKVIVRGVTQETNVGKIVVQGVPDVPGVAYKLFKALAEEEIIVDMIIQSAHHNQVNDIAFTVALNDFNKAIQITKHIAEEIGAKEVISESEVAKVSIVGAGITSDPAIAARMFGALAKEGVNIDMISTSGIKISRLIGSSRIKDAVKAIHEEFGLDKTNKVGVEKLSLFASIRAAGKEYEFKGKKVVVQELKDNSFDGIDIALFSGGDEVSKHFAPLAVQQGTIVVDNGKYFRMDPNVPLIVPEVNPDDLKWHKGLIANPNCSTIQMVMALKPIYDEVGIERVIVATYQSVSGTGKEAIEELKNQAASIAKGEEFEIKAYPYQIAYNTLPHIGDFQENGYTSEEIKMLDETRKILGDDNIRVVATTARVPVYRAHSEVVHVETKKKISVQRTREILSSFPGIKVIDNPDKLEYPLALFAEGKDEVFVGRIREDISTENGLVMWIVSDNLRKGAALNAVQIAEKIIEKKLFLK